MKNTHHIQSPHLVGAGIISLVLMLAVSSAVWDTTLAAAPAPQDDAAAVEMLRLAARMIRESAAEASGSEKGCYLSWGGFVECQSRKLSSGGRGSCPRPSCDFGNPTLAQMLATLDEEEDAESSESSPAPSAAGTTAGSVAPPSSAPRYTPSTGGSPSTQPAPRSPVATVTPATRPAPQKPPTPVANGGAAGRPGGAGEPSSVATAQQGSSSGWRLYQTYKNIDIYVRTVWESKTSFSIHWKGVNKNREPIDIRINYRVYGPRTFRGAPDYDWANTEFVMTPGGTNSNSYAHGDFSSIRLIQITRIELFKGGPKSAGGAY
ncbi:MAG: hypothetical protein LC800_00155 [Acidobacteria bacterium]|nr:hypothetical protein [Acidobacteriota bacterium]